MTASTDQPSLQPAKQPAATAVTWNPVAAVLLAISLFFISQIVGVILVSGYFAAQGLSSTQIEAKLTDSVYAQFSYILIAEIIILAVIYRFIKYYRSSIAAIGLVRPRLRDFGYALIAVVPYYVLFFITVTIVSTLVPGFDADQKQQIGFDNVQGFIPLALTFLILVILQPITEEIVVRGFIYSSLKKALPFVGAVIGTSLIFAAAHLPAGGAAGPLYIAGIDTFILSLFLIYLREKTGSLWASITLHSLKNGVAFLALFIFKVP